MRFIVFEKSAIEQLVNYRVLQTSDFALGSKLASFLRGGTQELEGIQNVFINQLDETIFLIGPEITDTYLVVDLKQSSLIEQTTDSEFIQVLQKVFRFTLKYWTKRPFTSSERIMEDQSKAVLYPFEFRLKNAPKVFIELEPLDQMAKDQLLLLYRYTTEDTAQNGTLDVTNFSESTELYSDIKKLAEDYFAKNKSNDLSEDSQKPLDFHEVTLESKVFSPFNSFEQWMKMITESQSNFIHKKNSLNPMRLQGPAGTGKTTTLLLKVYKLLSEAKAHGKDCRIIFFTHSKATQLSVKNIFNTMSLGEWSDGGEIGDGRSVLFTTLQDYCIDNLIKNIPENEILERDALDSKQLQYFAVCESYEKVKKESLKTLRGKMSSDLLELIEKSHGDQQGVICSLLQHEFSVMIKGKAGGDFDNYKNLPSLVAGLRLHNDFDKKFVFLVYSEYQEYFETIQRYDTDDIVLTAIGRLDNPVWRRRRKSEGYDFIFIDETHLFNQNEMMIFHFLTKDTDKYPIIFSLDVSQSIGDQGDIEDNFIDVYKKGVSVYKQEYDLVFRSSPQITDLAMAVTASGAKLFDHFQNPYKESSSAFTAAEEAICKKPDYILLDNEFSMVDYSLKTVEQMVKTMRCPISEIVIIAFTEELFGDVIRKLNEAGKRFIEIKKRGDIQAKIKASREGGLVVTMPEYVGGLEFYGAVLLGVDGARVPEKTSNLISKNYLTYTAYNKLYVSITRARYQLSILGVKDNGESPCLESSKSNKVIEVI